MLIVTYIYLNVPISTPLKLYVYSLFPINIKTHKNLVEIIQKNIDFTTVARRLLSRHLSLATLCLVNMHLILLI